MTAAMFRSFVRFSCDYRRARRTRRLPERRQSHPAAHPGGGLGTSPAPPDDRLRRAPCGQWPVSARRHELRRLPQSPVDRSFFPLVEFRDAATVVCAPWLYGRGADGLRLWRGSPRCAGPRIIYGFSIQRSAAASNPNFHDAGMAVALIDQSIIDYLTDQKLAVPNSAIVIGQSAGGWAAIALSSLNLPSVKAIVVFAAGRGGRVDGKPNNNCAPDKLVEATADFGHTARVPMLWIYIQNDTYFGPDLSKTNARSLHRRRRERRIPPDAAVRQRRTHLYRFSRLHSAMVAAGQPVPRQASLVASWR